MKAKLKENWKEYLLYGTLGIWILVFGVIFYNSAQAGCTEDAGIVLNQGGLCLARGLAGMSCLFGYFGLWTVLGGAVAQGKGRNPIIGWILGLTLQFVGCLFMLMWEPRRDNLGRMIGWSEYKHFTMEQREAIRPVRAPDTPQDKRRKKIVVVIAFFVLLLAVFQVLKNLGKI